MKLWLSSPVCLAASLFASTVLAPTARAQDSGGSGAETIIRSESRLVLVDAVALDKKGKFAQDLTERNFRLWEDGKEQKITSFSLESSGISPERPSKHYIVMYFDTATAGQAGQLVVRQQATRFVDGFASPDRYMAVITYAFDGGLHVPQNFTTDADKLRKALAGISGTAAGTPTTTTAPPPRVGRGAPPAPVTSTDPYVAHDYLASLRNLAKSLSSIRGRKALVLFSVGAEMNGENTGDALTTIEALNKANVAVYTVGSGVTQSVPDSSGASSAGRTTAHASTAPAGTDLAASNQSLGRALAEGTGGITFVSTNDLAADLGKVAQEQDQYYLLGYTPSVDSQEGSCHDLRVKLDRGDLEVRARKGYCTSKPVDLLSGKPAGSTLEAKAASGAPGNIPAKMQVPWFYSAPNTARVNLAMDIVPAATKFQKDKGKFHGEFDLAGVAYRKDGSVAARVSDVVKLEFDTQQQVDAFLKTPYHYENQFEIAPGQYTFRIALSVGEQGFGKVEMPLSIEPWNGQTLGASGLALSHDAHPAADLAASLDVSLLEGQRPLVSKGTEVVPTGTNLFRVGEHGVFYFEAYEPLLTGTKPDATLPPVGVRVRVLDRASGQQKEDTGVKIAGSYMRPGNPIVPIVASIPGSALPAGAYKLEVTVMRPTGEPVVRTADFDIQ